MKRFGTLLLGGALLLPLGACGSFGIGSPQENQPLEKGPAVQTDESPYEPALTCVDSHLTPEQRHTAFSVAGFRDATGKVNIASDSGTGDLNTQGGAEHLLTALYQTGVKVVNTADPAFLNLVKWDLEAGLPARFLGDGMSHTVEHAKDPKTGKELPPYVTWAITPRQGEIRQPDYVIQGGITSADFLPGDVAEAYIMGIGGGGREYRMLIGMDATVTRMPFSDEAPGTGGVIIATDRLSKQLYAYELKAGVATFFNSPTTYTDVNIDHARREPVQYAERLMLDRLAFDLVTKTFKLHHCDSLLAQIERGLAPPPRKGDVQTRRQDHSS